VPGTDTTHPAWRWAFAATCAVNLVVLYSPSGDGAQPFPEFDKVVHVLVFAAVMWTGARAGLPVRLLLPVLLLHAVVSEVVQATLLPHRDGDVFDALADTAGTVAAAVLVTAFPHRRRRGTIGV